MASPAFPKTQRIGIFVFDKFEPIDVFGFVQAFSIARFLGTGYFSRPALPVRDRPDRQDARERQKL